MNDKYIGAEYPLFSQAIKQAIDRANRAQETHDEIIADHDGFDAQGETESLDGVTKATRQLSSIARILTKIGGLFFSSKN